MATSQRELDVSNLKDIIEALKQGYFPNHKWLRLGLQLGLLPPTLEDIEANYRNDVMRCLQKCLTLWLKKTDKVTENGGPTLDSLADALERIEETFAAEKIKEFKELSAATDKLSPLTLPMEIVQMLYTERVISKETLDEVNRLGGVLGDGPLRAIHTTVSKEPSKLRVLTSILLKSEQTVSVAKDILKEYNQTYPYKVTLQRTYQYDFDQMRVTFGKLIHDVAPLIEAGIPSLNELKTYLRRCFRELKPQLSLAKSFDDVMDLVEDKCSIINICCLESIVDQYDITDAKPHVTEFKTTVDAFCEKVKLSVCCKESFKRILSCHHLLTCETIEFVLEWKTDEHTLNDIRDLLSKAFKDLVNNVQIRVIMEGNSIIVTCYAPHHMMDILLVTAKENFGLVKKMGLLKLTIGYDIIYDKHQRDKEVRPIVEEKTKELRHQLELIQTIIRRMTLQISTIVQQSEGRKQMKEKVIEDLTSVLKQKEVTEKELLSVLADRRKELETLQEIITSSTLRLRDRDKQIKNLRDTEEKEKELVENFAKLFSNLKQNLFHVKVTDVASYLSTLTNGDFIPQLQNATTFDEIFALTSPFISFNQYDLLKCLVEQFGRSDIKTELQEYNAEVDEFNQKTTVGQLMEVMEKQQRECRDKGREVLRKVDIATIKMKFGINYKEKTLDQLHLDISTIFECKDYVLTLAEANLSANQLTWYTAKSTVEQLTRKATEKKNLLDDIGVLALKVGPDVIVGEISSSESKTSITSSSSLFDTIWEAIDDGNVDQVHTSLDLPEDNLQTILRQSDKQKTTLLHFAIKCNQLKIVKVILSAIYRCSMKKLIWVSDANGMSPLELAVNAENLDIIKAILTYPTSVIIPPNYTNLLPLALSNLNNNAERSIEMAKLILNHSKGNPLVLYPTFPQHFPGLNVPITALEHTVPVVVVGDSNAGKSTLIKSLQIQGIRSQLWHFFFKVQDVDDHKAGIIPTVFDSTWYGNVVFYDLSSHREFVHEAILQFRYLPDAVFIIVVNLYKEIDDIAKQIVYWLSFIRYHHERAKGYTTRPNVIIVGSKFYNPRFGRLGHVERFYHYAYPRAHSHIDIDQFNIIAKVLMDCRNSSLSNVILRQYLSSAFQRLRVNRPQLPTKCYLLYAIIKQLCQPKNEGAVQVIDILAKLCSDHLYCKMFNSSVDEVLELCHPLSELDLLVVLENKQEKERSWIIFNSHPLLQKVEETIFQTERLVGGDGILSRDEIVGLFGNLPEPVVPELMLQMMIHYCYCNKVPVPLSLESQEDRYFFPHLLPEVLDITNETGQLMFAWSFSAERYHYFMPHFIHHFLLVLSQDPEVSEGVKCNRARRTLLTSFPLVGVKLVVHIDSNQTILVSMKSDNESDKGKIMSMIKRNHLICKITKILESIDPNMERNVSPVEALIPISGENAQYYPVVKPPKCQLLFRSVDLQYSTEKIKQAIITRSQVQPIRSAQPFSSVENLLSFEPYFYMDDEVRRTLLHPPHPDETISFEFFESIGLALQLEKLCLLLAAIGINMAVIDSFKNDSIRSFSEKLHEAYQHVFGKGVTYKELHQCLDDISFFKLKDLL